MVILDNCEHVVDAAAALAVRLLDAAPGLRILCTSQVPLDVDGEFVFELAPLPLSDGVELFTRRAAAQRRGGAVGPDTGVVRELCRSLDGLPLAIELAAARTRTLSVEEITRRLDDRFVVLADPTSRKPERRRSLRSTISWSYDLLFPDDQRGLWALATFADGAPLAAVEFVLEALDVPSAAAIDVVGRLASRSLVTVDDPGAPSLDTAPDLAGDQPIRYRLLDSIRAFALEAMSTAGLAERARAAHAAWFADAAGSSTDGVRSARQAQHLAFARTERANIEAALAWGAAHDPTLALRIVNGFGWAWVVLGDSRGAQRILAALEAYGDAGRPGTGPTPSCSRRGSRRRPDTSTWHGTTSRRPPSWPRRPRTPTCGPVAPTTSLMSSPITASSAPRWSSPTAARPSTTRSTGRGTRPRTGSSPPGRPSPSVTRPVPPTPPSGCNAGSRRRRPWLHVRGEAMLGELARLQHRFDDAVRHLSRAADRSRQLGFQQTEAYQVTTLGRAQCQAGDYDAGVATLELAIEKAQATGDVRLVALGRVHLGRVLRATGRDDRAREALEAADCLAPPRRGR